MPAGLRIPAGCPASTTGPQPSIPAQVPNQDIRVSEKFLEDHEELLHAWGERWRAPRSTTPGRWISTCGRHLEALIRTYRTLQSGVYYESVPAIRWRPVSIAAVQRRRRGVPPGGAAAAGHVQDARRRHAGACWCFCSGWNSTATTAAGAAARFWTLYEDSTRMRPSEGRSGSFLADLALSRRVRLTFSIRQARFFPVLTTWPVYLWVPFTSSSMGRSTG